QATDAIRSIEAARVHHIGAGVAGNGVQPAVSSAAMKTRGRKTTKQKTPKRASGRRRAAAGGRKSKGARHAREPRGAHQQPAATSEVLRVISSSPGDLTPVFGAMMANATRLCEASYGTMWLQEGDGFRAAARVGVLPAVSNEKWWTGTHFQPRSDVPLARCARSRKAVHVADMRTERGYLEGDPW